MNILHVIPTLSLRAGGPPTVVLDLVKYQTRQGDNVVICTTDRDEPPKRTIIAHLKKIIKDDGINVAYFQAFTPLLISPKMLLWLIKNIKRFDIVHVHSLYRFPSSIAAFLARLFNIPYIIRPHGSLDPFLYNRTRYGSVLLKRLYEKVIDLPNLKRAKLVHFTSKIEKELTAYLDLPMNDVIIPNGIDWSKYESLPQPGIYRKSIGVDRDAKLILFLGRINFKKGLDLLIPAFALFLKKFSNSYLVIVGPDNEGYLGKVKLWIKENNIEKNVIIRGPVKLDEAKQAYVDSDLFVLTSYSENFGMTVIEALACGCPVLISNNVNIYKDLKECPIVRITSLDIQEITKKMVDFFKEGTITYEVKEKARIFIKEKYSYDVIIKRVYTMYKEAIGVQK